MNIRVTKARAFEIDPTKKYIVMYESDVNLTRDIALKIKKSMSDIFSDMGVKAYVAVSVKGRLVITEVKK